MTELIKLFEECELERYRKEVAESQELIIDKPSENIFKKHYDLFINKLKNHNIKGNTETGENLDGIKDNGLTNDEAYVIYMYTHHNVYKTLNLYLRNGQCKIYKDWDRYRILLNYALSKVKSVDNTVIYRDIRNPENNVDKCLSYYEKKIGKVITFNEFLSCHTDNVRISDEKTEFRFIIETALHSNGKDIQNISFIANEKEVLFKSRTKFLIKKVDKDNNEVFMIEE